MNITIKTITQTIRMNTNKTTTIINKKINIIIIMNTTTIINMINKTSKTIITIIIIYIILDNQLSIKVMDKMVQTIR
jgi:hypothetical protein